MSDPPVTGLLGLLAHRGALLERVSAGVTDRRELVAELGVSRSTVNRGIRNLQEQGLVAERPDGIELTRYGRLALDLYRTADQLVAAEGLVGRLPTDIPLATIRNAEIVCPERPVPQRPVDAIVGLVREAGEVRAIAPVVTPAVVEATVERASAGGLEATVLVDETVLEGLWNVSAEQISSGLDAEAYTLLSTERAIEFGLMIVDERVVSIGAHDDSGRLLGLLINEDRATLEWARETFDAYRRSAEEVRT